MACTMNISLPQELKSFVDEQVAERGFSSNSEYLRELIRKQRDIEKLRGLLREGAASPVEGEFDEDYFAGLRQRVHDGARANTKG